MKLSLQSDGFRITAALDEFIRLRLRHALGRYHDAVDRVAVHMRDDNGPRGGIDKRVRLLVDVRGHRPVLIDECAADLYMAIGRGSVRAERQVARSLERRRHLARR